MTTDPAARLLRLLSLLQARPSWTGPQLAERLGVTTRTVRRDVDRLRGLGYPVDGAPGIEGGYRLGPGGELPPLLLDDDEATAVAVALRSAAGGTVAGIEEASLSALSKLDRVLPPRLRARVAAVRAMTVSLGGGGGSDGGRGGGDAGSVDPDVLVAAAHACAGAERVRVTYRDRHGVVSERRLEPYRMVATGRRWYLVARDVDRAVGGAPQRSGASSSGAPPTDDGWRTFRVDRIASLEPTGHRFRLDDPPDAAALVSEGVSVAPYSFVARVRVATTAAALRLRVPPTVGVVEADGPDHALLVTGGDDLDLLAGHLVALGVAFEVLDPPELRSLVAEIGRRLTAAHPSP